MDLIGPLERSARGHRFALVLVDYATRYPEAVALRNISAKSVAESLFSMISRVGIPKEILTDQGTAFMSRTIRELYELLGIKSVRTSVYHPQTDGLVERFNRTLKTMIRKFVHEDELGKIGTSGWNPFCLLCGRSRKLPRGFPPSSSCMAASPAGFWTSWGRLGRRDLWGARMKFSMCWTWEQNSTLWGSSPWRICYGPRTSKANRGARLRNFTPGDKVLVLLPTSSSKLLAKWQGPFEVTRRVGNLNYEVIRTDRSGARQIYHLNLLKKWSEVEPVMLAMVVSGEEDLGPEVNTKIPSLTLAPRGGITSHPPSSPM